MQGGVRVPRFAHDIVYRLADRWLAAAQLLFLAALSGTIMMAALWLEQPVLLQGSQ